MDKQEATERIEQNKAAAEFYAQLSDNPKFVDEELKDIEAFNMTIEALKSERPKGEWKHGRELSRVFIGDALRGINYEDWHCSNCHCVVEQSIKPKWGYCPNCGADMRGADDD